MSLSVDVDGDVHDVGPAAPLRLPVFNDWFSPSSPTSTSPSASGAAAASIPSARAKMRWGLWSPNDAEWMQLVQDNYDKHHRLMGPVRGDGEPPLIPLKIHHIWLGSPLPEAFARLRESWLARHVGHSGQGRGQERSNGSSTPWEVRLWTDADINAFGLENRGAFDAAQNFGQKSDILRYEILLRHGGLYVDVDFLCLDSFDDLHRRYEFYAGVSNTGTFELNNGLIGCRPGHPIMRDIVNRIKDSCCCSQPSSTPPSHPHPPISSSSSVAAAAAAALSYGVGASGGVADAGGDGGGRGTTVGDPLSALMGALGEEGGGGGLLAGLLGGDDRASLRQAVEVEADSATETIVKTGPGVFTRAVMAWMVSSATGEDGATPPATTGDSGTSSTAEEDIFHSAGTAARDTARVPGSDVLGGGGGGSDGSGGATFGTSSFCSPNRRRADNNTTVTAAPAAAAAAAVATLAATPPAMILPPSYLYPVPNNAAAAKAGLLIGDGTESEVRERVGGYLSSESLAAHLWGRSWQQQQQQQLVKE
ncbi:unnamed protein product [Ectocarpus fasciculatus]